MLGYDPEDLVGQNGFEYQSSETVKAVEEAIEYVIEYPDESQTVQTKFRRADGSWCWIEATIQNQLEDDLIEGLLVNSRDITERKEYEQTLKNSVTIWRYSTRLSVTMSVTNSSSCSRTATCSKTTSKTTVRSIFDMFSRPVVKLSESPKPLAKSPRQCSARRPIRLR